VEGLGVSNTAVPFSTFAPSGRPNAAVQKNKRNKKIKVIPLNFILKL
jgi:hypothetical protein